MANQEHLIILQGGVWTWNKWRETNSKTTPDLSGANLSGSFLHSANLRGVDLQGANWKTVGQDPPQAVFSTVLVREKRSIVGADTVIKRIIMSRGLYTDQVDNRSVIHKQKPMFRVAGDEIKMANTAKKRDLCGGYSKEKTNATAPNTNKQPALCQHK